VGRVAVDLLEVYATARRGPVPAGLRADGPATSRPGDRLAPDEREPRPEPLPALEPPVAPAAQGSTRS